MLAYSLQVYCVRAKRNQTPPQESCSDALKILNRLPISSGMNISRAQSLKGTCDAMCQLNFPPHLPQPPIRAVELDWQMVDPTVGTTSPRPRGTS